ncbi:hypothetical protein UVI_02041380 [Ustilaginoidea virens]|uniref:Hyaluronan/mRNA-binding protein domain-containing protein n=1 Tax=Ustilaginoidea virens TaxID=1159556 RepID=A0A1B5KYV7_USTVR|nr:hypothetical protein UVI_02041380 [Ustilaginoidea virens]
MYESPLPCSFFSVVLSTPSLNSLISDNMTRSHKANDRDHKGIADGTAAPVEYLPRYFAKSGYVDADPKKMKKDGNGKGNWGTIADDVMDHDFKFTNARRRSNSSTASHHINDFKTKFEVIDAEPVFEESVHGPAEEDELSKTDSSESGHSAA